MDLIINLLKSILSSLYKFFVLIRSFQKDFLKLYTENKIEEAICQAQNHLRDFSPILRNSVFFKKIRTYIDKAALLHTLSNLNYTLENLAKYDTNMGFLNTKHQIAHQRNLDKVIELRNFFAVEIDNF